MRCRLKSDRRCYLRRVGLGCLAGMLRYGDIAGGILFPFEPLRLVEMGREGLRMGGKSLVRAHGHRQSCQRGAGIVIHRVDLEETLEPAPGTVRVSLTLGQIAEHLQRDDVFRIQLQHLLEDTLRFLVGTLIDETPPQDDVPADIVGPFFDSLANDFQGDFKLIGFPISVRQRGKPLLGLFVVPSLELFDFARVCHVVWAGNGRG